MKDARSALRERIRSGAFRSTTSGLCPGSVQANLVVLSRAHADDFRAFCDRNPKPCPLIEQTAPGAVAPASAPRSDLRTDVPRYRVYRDGRLEDEPVDLLAYWRDDLVSFLLGCSFTFERALSAAGLPLRHQEEGKVVPMYVTSRPCAPAGPFSGPMVVSMRPVAEERVAEVVAITSRFELSHGAPVHCGDPATLGIGALERPDYGEPVTLRPGEVPVFWACGVTPQAVAREAKLDLVMTHAPGHMFVTDLDEPEIAPYN